MTVRVVLADDQELIRTALRMVMADIEDMDVVGRRPPAWRPWP